MGKLLVTALMIAVLGGCASTSTTVKGGGGSQSGVGGTASVGTGIKF
jgi:hypothetical protein